VLDDWSVLLDGERFPGRRRGAHAAARGDVACIATYEAAWCIRGDDVYALPTTELGTVKDIAIVGDGVAVLTTGGRIVVYGLDGRVVTRHALAAEHTLLAAREDGMLAVSGAPHGLLHLVPPE